MVKECKVISRNALVMVVAYDDKMIQMPTDSGMSNKVFVKYEKGNYTLTDGPDATNSVKKRTKKTAEKKLFDEAVNSDVEIDSE